MIVRTIREHHNSHPPVYTKHLRRQYEVEETEGRRLIGLGYVEEVKPKGSDE